ncbi:MAG: hypothetical protein E6H79_15940 [Betaproteobacteria bacterium]|nr:MAG: hypothetical protein E6H79_15940 [Betaproteobacteria bacterium]
MDIRFERFRLAYGAAALLALAACGGGGSSAPTTTNVTTTVVDGALKNVTVCLDKNGNGKCDADEVHGKTDANGNVTLAVPNADVGKYPILAVVGTDAIDADTGAVPTAYTLTAPADTTSVVSPLTTLVQQTIASTGASTSDAARTVQDATGLTVSLFQDYTKVAAPTDGTVNAGTLARLLVITTQQQTSAIAGTVGTTAIDGSTITQADIDKAIQKKLLELLPDVVSALTTPAVLAATTPADKEAALLAAANTLVGDSGLTPAAVSTVVAINNQATATTTTTTTPSAGYNLRALSFTSATNYFFRVFTGSAAQNTPDANNNVKYVDRRVRNVSGNIAKWNYGGDPYRQADLHWNGSAWVNCPLNFESTASQRDVQGNNIYNYCDSLETGKSSRATFDISGKTMADVYAQIRAAGYTNLTIFDSTVLGTATFPTGSALFYQSGTPLTEAIAYYPSGAKNPDGTSNVVTQYSAAVSAGGTASTQAAGTACNSTEASTNGTNVATLEALIASKTGTPCVYAQGSFVYNGVTYYSDTPNEWWGNSTVSLGKLGTAPLNTGTAPGYYTTNTLLRIAFTGSGTNPVTYYACKERFNNGSTRNCTAIGTGSYTITTLGDARVLTLANPPAQAAPLTYNRVFVERGGAVYFGYQSKLIVSNSARLNTIAADALLGRLGIPAEDPSVPMALTPWSYQGAWDIHSASATDWSHGTTVYIGPAGTVSCQDRATLSFFSCTLTVTDPSTGAFTYSSASETASGNASFLAGTVSATSSVNGALVGYRR